MNLSVFVTVLVIFIFAATLFVFEKAELAPFFTAATALDSDVADDDSYRHDQHNKQEYE